MKTSGIVAAVILLLGISFGGPVGAEETPAEKPYSGDLWTQLRFDAAWRPGDIEEAQ